MGIAKRKIAKRKITNDQAFNLAIDLYEILPRRAEVIEAENYVRSSKAYASTLELNNAKEGTPEGESTLGFLMLVYLAGRISRSEIHI